MNIKKLQVKGNRESIRKQVVTMFLKEEPGTGKGENSSKYRYDVEILNDGSKIYLRRPAPLNKGFDFEIHVENIKFRDRGRVHMPSHSDIVEDLKIKKEHDMGEYCKVSKIINKIYNCENILDLEYLDIIFNVGFPIEVILKSIKWLFIEQDITYWNWSGRNMLFNKLKEEGLC